MKNTVLSIFQRGDWIFALVIFTLLVIGLISLASLSTTAIFPFFERQIIWVVLGIATFFIFASIDYRIFRNYSGLLLVAYLILVLTLLVLIFTGRHVRGVVSWFHIGSLAIEPGEFIKAALILILAKYFSRRHVEIYRLRHLIISGLYAGIPAFLVLIQPDLGEAAIIGSIWLGIVLSSGIKLKHFLFFCLLFVVLVVFGWYFVLQPYQHARIVAFLNPWKDPRGSGYNAIQSMVAVGSGGFWGKGVGYGSQTHLNFLPEPATDFIFAAFAEEWGFVGVFFLLVLYGILFWRLFRVGIRAGDNFARLTVLGIATVIFVHLMIHAGMNVGILPITGITLPFVSYGGSSLLTMMVFAGIVESIAIRSLRATSH